MMMRSGQNMPGSRMNDFLKIDYSGEL